MRYLGFFLYFCPEMEYIANIITNNKFEASAFFNITSDFESVNKKIPTLIIGWGLVKTLFPEQNILDFKITEDISWTFSKREKRFQYEKDILLFTDNVIKKLEKKINYRFFNYILSTQERREAFINYINKGNCYIYHNSRFLYIYSALDMVTIGISLNDLSYIGININDFIKSLNRNNNNVIYNNLKFIDENSLWLIKENIKAAAYLNYLKNSDIYKERTINGKEYKQTL